MITGSRRFMRFGAAVQAIVIAGASGVRVRAGVEDSLVTVRSHPLRLMGTACSLTVVVPQAKKSTGREALTKAEARVRRVEALMSAYREDSEVRRLKSAPAGQRIALSSDTLEVLRAARHFAEVTGGAFDVTAAPLFRLWKRSAERDRPPTNEELAAARAASGWERFTLLADGAVKATASAEVDLGGIAKGYAIDGAIEAMRSAGCAGGLADIGGDIRCFGTKPGGRPWRIAVRSPSGRSHAGVLELKSAAVCTSGDYLRFLEIRGRRYGHIVDPRSGMPVATTPSVTVIAPDATKADSLATAISVLGPKEGLALANRLDGVECLVMVYDPTGKPSLARSTGFPGLMQEQ